MWKKHKVHHRAHPFGGPATSTYGQEGLEEAAAAGTRGLILAQRNGRPALLATAYAIAFWVRAYAGMVPRIVADDVWVLVQNSEDPLVRSHALGVLGLDALVRGGDDAIPLLRASGVGADEAGHTHTRCLYRSYLAVAEAQGDPTRALRGLRVALVEYGAARLPFGPRGHAHDFIPSLAALEAWTAIAVLDGATPSVSLFPDAVRHAKASAHSALGDEAYDTARQHGRTLSHPDYEAFLHAELDALHIPDVVPEVQ